MWCLLCHSWHAACVAPAVPLVACCMCGAGHATRGMLPGASCCVAARSPYMAMLPMHASQHAVLSACLAPHVRGIADIEL